MTGERPFVIDKMGIQTLGELRLVRPMYMYMQTELSKTQTARTL